MVSYKYLYKLYNRCDFKWVFECMKKKVIFLNLEEKNIHVSWGKFKHSFMFNNVFWK